MYIWGLISKAVAGLALGLGGNGHRETDGWADGMRWAFTLDGRKMGWVITVM